MHFGAVRSRMGLVELLCTLEYHDPRTWCWSIYGNSHARSSYMIISRFFHTAIWFTIVKETRCVYDWNLVNNRSITNTLLLQNASLSLLRVISVLTHVVKLTRASICHHVRHQFHMAAGLETCQTTSRPLITPPCQELFPDL